MASLEALTLTQELIREVSRDGDLPDIDNNILDLLQRGADVNGTEDHAADQHGQTPLIISARKGGKSVRNIVELLKQENLDINARYRYGRTALIMASYYGHEEVVRILLKHKYLDMNAADRYGNTALSLASYYGHEGVVRILLEEHDRVNVNAENDWGCDALMTASYNASTRNGYEAVVRILLKDDRVDVNAKGDDGATALIEASMHIWS